MDFKNKRSQFSIYLLSEDAIVLEAESGIADSGYKFTTLPWSQDSLERLKAEPPHIVYVDKEWFGCVQEILRVSPESLVIPIVDQVDQGLAFQDSAYDFLLRPLLRAESLLWMTDRACERLYHQYKAEQLIEKLADKKNGIDNVQPETLSEIKQLSAIETLNSTSVAALFSSFVKGLAAIKNPADGLQYFLDLFCEKVDPAPVVFFKYISNPASFVISQCAGADIAKVRGVGIYLEAPVLNMQNVVENDKVLRQLNQLLREAFSCETSEKVAFFVENQISGLLVVLGGFKSVQSRDLFYSMLYILNLQTAYQKVSFEVQSLQVLSPLTGLYNRGFFERCLAEEISRARRIKQPVSLISLQIDFFADYQRRAGNEYAQKILIAVADVLKRTSRLSDILIDLQGGSFALLLPHTSQHGASAKAEKIRRIIENAKFPYAELLAAKKITVSQGIGEYPGTSADGDTLLKSADDALFYVKKQGGNDVSLATVVAEFNPDFEVEA